MLIMLTDQPGLYTADPRTHTDAELIERVVPHIDESTVALAGGAGTTLGTGGMVTKIEAAQLASRSGVTTIIAAGREPNVLTRIIAGEEIGTRFEAAADHLESRKRWLLAEKPRGEIGWMLELPEPS
jgi:glutamate 5-kinase